MAVEQKAHLSYLRIAPRKTRSVANLIKGLSVNEAEAQLLVERRRPAKPLLKLLRSAVANAKNNQKDEQTGFNYATFDCEAYTVTGHWHDDAGKELWQRVPTDPKWHDRPATQEKVN